MDGKGMVGVDAWGRWDHMPASRIISPLCIEFRDNNTEFMFLFWF